MRELLWMAEGAFAPHAENLSLLLRINTKQGTKGIDPADLNPYTVKVSPPEIKSSAGVLSMRAMANGPVHDIGRIDL